MSNTKQQPIWTKSFIGISMTQFMVFMIFYTLLTTLPIYVINNLGGSEADGGLIVTVMLIAAIIVRPISAKLLDTTGKKRGLVLSVALFTVTTFFYIWIDSFIPLLVLRFFHGLSFGVITTATGAIAADVIPHERRGAGLGYFAMAMNLAVVAGPFIGLSLLQFVTFKTLFIILSILMIAGLIFSMSVHVPQESNDTAKATKHKFSLSDLIEIKAIPIALISSFVSLAYASILSFISVYSESIGLSASASYFFLVFAIIMLLSRPYFGRTFDVKGPNHVILPCLFIFAVGLVTLGFTGSAWMLLLSAGLIGLGYGTLLPSFQTMAIQTAHHSRSGHATATFFMLYDSGIAIGSFVWGLVAAGVGFQNLYLINAILVVVVIGLFLLYQSRQQKEKYAEKKVYREIQSSE
ncbi:MFS transporter [Virgibacillus oceani]|uniref:MFS-type transporter YwoG n=1 Tax=Virgibacillus oceani TaxID=1479511 RepID=A0A917M9X7_9BACI|nr:MFS transporter [Virgibacillus oceani]GGG87046.1 putative MFS-type transporter YwoG [Virgibacillus oceani]